MAPPPIWTADPLDRTLEDIVRRLFILIPVLLIGGVPGLWLRTPDRIQVMEMVWVSIGQPDWKGRAIAVAVFGAIVFVLSARLLKSGPL